MSRKSMSSISLWTEKPKRMNSVTLVLFLSAIYSRLSAAEKRQNRVRDKLLGQGTHWMPTFVCFSFRNHSPLRWNMGTNKHIPFQTLLASSSSFDEAKN